MSESNSENGNDKEITVIYKVMDEQSSSEEPPMSEWSSFELVLPEENMKKLLTSQGLYSPGSREMCTKYIGMSDSDIFGHPYYKYPAILDPGIKEALLSPEKPIIYPDDGQKLYLALCSEMKLCPISMFYKNLLSEEINLNYYGICPQGIYPIAMALQFNKYVHRLDLTENFLNDDACYHLGHMLASNFALSELNLTGCRIGTSGMLQLGQNLFINRSLTTLNLARNNIGDDGGIYLANFIFDGAMVPRLNLSNNKLGRIAALALEEVLDFKNNLTHLDLSWNNLFNAPSMVKLINRLAESEVLEELNLSWNSLEGDRIADAIKNLILVPTLVILDLSNNRFQDKAIQQITNNLIMAKKLKTLDLSSNPLSPADALYVLQRMLKPRVKLQNLFLRNVCVNKKFITTLEIVKRMKSRANFKIVFGTVLQNYVLEDVDAKKLILERANYLGNFSKKHKTDIPLYFLRLCKELGPTPVPIKTLMDRVATDSVPLDEDLLTEMTYVFPGPKSGKTRSVNLQQLTEYVHRLWPDKKLPPTPPPEPEPEPISEQKPTKGKGKPKGKGKK